MESCGVRRATGYVEDGLGRCPLTDDDQLLFTLGHHTDHSLLILGETGVGKTRLAKLIHDGSRRRHAPFVVVDCGAIAESLFEAELFGHRKGAFTGAVHTNGGLVARADSGTLFLDEVGNLPAAAQAKLLRLIEARSFRAVGESAERSADVRFIAATNIDVVAAVRSGRLREDLYYRLTVAEPVRIRPLRERPSAIRELADSFVSHLAAGANVKGALGDRAFEWLEAQSWPGNVRQLKGVVEVAFELARVRWLGSPQSERVVIQVQDLVRVLGDRASSPSEFLTPVADTSSSSDRVSGVDRSETVPRPSPHDPTHRDWVVSVIERAGRNQSRAAILAGVSRRTMINWIERYGLPRPRVDYPSQRRSDLFEELERPDSRGRR